MTSKCLTRVMAMLLLAGALIGAMSQARAQEAVTVSISVKNHRFQPAEVQAPANVPIILRVKNLDATPMEFESVSLRVEKVVTRQQRRHHPAAAAGARPLQFLRRFQPAGQRRAGRSLATT